MGEGEPAPVQALEEAARATRTAARPAVPALRHAPARGEPVAQEDRAA
jgi:hypothetical protein